MNKKKLPFVVPAVETVEMLILAVDKVRSSVEEEEDVVRIIFVVLFVDFDVGLVVVDIFIELVKFEVVELVKLVRVEVKLPDV